jgi:GMP synthase (glutamine-hydrolysing)
MSPGKSHHRLKNLLPEKSITDMNDASLIKKPTDIAPQHDAVVIYDFGSQVTQLIARRVREAGVYCEIHPHTKPFSEIKTPNISGIILSGGPASVHLDNAPDIDASIFEKNIPILGICYGQQLMCSMLGGKVSAGESREFGRAQLSITSDHSLFTGVWQQNDNPSVWMSHGDHISSLPDGFVTLATSKGAPHAIMADDTRRFYGVQFHPEVVHTPEGAALIGRFVHDICGLKGDWSMGRFKEEAIAKIRAQVGDGKVICGLSGGVDSSVVAKLIHEAIGDQLVCVFVDNGLLRKDEGKQVREAFADHYDIPLIYVDASALFLGRLQGVDEPERKRKIIGETFIEIFEREAEAIGDAEFLAQGTLYPDVIESVSVHGGPSGTIKSHHNVGGLPEYMQLKLVEPLRALFKDEVRALGLELGLPKAMVMRHPFPGPGLGIRILGAVSADKCAILREADAIYMNALREHDLYGQIWQAYAALLPVKTVGVMGDARTYEYICSLRAVVSTDGMTADCFNFPHEIITDIAARIVNEVKGINRVMLDVTSKPPATIELE